MISRIQPGRSSATVRAAVHLAIALSIGAGVIETVEAADPKPRIEIATGPAGQTLKQFAEQTGLQLLFDFDAADRLTTHSVSGQLDAAEALTRMLAGTGLAFEFVNDRTVTVTLQKSVKRNTSVGSSLSSIVGEDRGEGLRSSILQAQAAEAASSDKPEEQNPKENSDQLQEVVVTANRRRQTLEEVPYSITAVSAEQIARTGVTDIASLANQVPGLSMYNYGARASGSVFPIIRGLNASASSSGFRTFEQHPVGTYIGNSPIDGYFQFDDVQRIEVLKGPQGTLYGAGALGGALRVIPNAPQLDSFSGNVELGGGTLAHSSGASYTASGVLNVPIGDTLAFRAAGKYASEPGFIDVHGILERTPAQAGGIPVVSGIPVLANPADPVNSAGVFTGKKDWNDQNTFTGRASLLWKPADRFNAELAFVYASVNGDGGPIANPDFPGGSYPIDPRITFPRGGDYQDFAATDQPFSRRTALTSLDLSYDAGFATLSSTSSYYTTTGSGLFDGTYADAAYPGILAPGYYGGNPLNPRYVNPILFRDSAHTFTQEVRLVSTTGPDKLFDYVVGVFYERQMNYGSLDYAQSGSPEYSRAEGCTAPFYFGASFPNCLVIAGPGDVSYQVLDTQRFQDKSEFAELTWHFVKHGQITFGGRHFEQSFTDAQAYSTWPFATFVPALLHSAPASKNTWKVNPSYEYATNHHVYALWSQGFRRGGANSLPTSPPRPPGLGDNPSLLTYGPDSVNNYEIGLKGRFTGDLSYTFDVFDIQWDKPEIAGATPGGNYAVWNANKARSTGVEFDLNTPLFLPGLSITVGGAYADARFTENYLITDGVLGNIVGQAGQQLPGSPKVSAAATINYERNLAPGYRLAVSLNDTYRSAEVLSTFGTASFPPTRISGMDIANLSASVTHQAWRLGAYVTNVADRRVVLAPPTLHRVYNVDNLINQFTINQPREIGLRLSYSF